MAFFGGGGGGAASNMVGATSSVAGTAGLVPAPSAGDQDKVLFGNATFKGSFFVPALTPFTKSTSRYYSHFLLGGAPDAGNMNMTNNGGAYFCPFVINGSATVSQIAFINHTANVNLAPVVGVYRSDINTGWPLTKIAQATAANLSSTAAGTVVVTAITAAVVGLFWVCVYNPTSISFGIKANDSNNIGNMFMNTLAGIGTIGTLVRGRLSLNNSSISSSVFPTTLSSSDLSVDAAPIPSLFVSY